MSTTCNEHGVYSPTEVLRLPRDRKGWRGMDLCEIELADLGDHWIWATGFTMFSGDCWGSYSPLRKVHGREAATRGEAIQAASDHLRAKLAGRAAGFPDARAIIAWLDGLRPAQLSLFGAAA